jgi:spore maturation protein CgeB
MPKPTEKRQTQRHVRLITAPLHDNLEDAIEWCQRAKVTLTFTGHHVVAHFNSRPMARVTSNEITTAVQALRHLPLSAFNQRST